MKAQDEPKAKIGAGHAGAMLRKGWHELGAATYTESNVAQPNEHGLFGTKTPGEVAEERRLKERDMDEEPQRGSVFDGINRRAEACRDDRELEREEPEPEP